jgi:hypothetical protein
LPITYERDDARRLITVTVTEPYTVEELFGAIDRQAAEDTWEYAMLCDVRAMHVSTDAGARQLADHVKAVGGGRTRGPVGLVLAATPEQFRRGMQYTEVTRKFADVEVLLTAAQRDDWSARNARSRKV